MKSINNTDSHNKEQATPEVTKPLETGIKRKNSKDLHDNSDLHNDPHIPQIEIHKKIKLESKEENGMVLSQIRDSYQAGREYYQEHNLELAKKEFIQVLKPALSKTAMENGDVEINDCKEELLNAMYHLGLIYLNNNEYPNHHAKAAAIFQYCAGFAKKYKVGNNLDFLTETHSVETKFLSSINKQANSQGLESNLSKYKQDLEEVRNRVKKELSKIHDLKIEQLEEKTNGVEKIYKDCTRFFVNNDSDKNEKPGLVQKLLKDCFQQLGNPPANCEYAIIGLGSLAGGRMTPWSDLEFAILINEDKPEFKEYFRNLTKLLHIKVINLGETPLRSVGIESLNNFKSAKAEEEWFWDEVTNNGFSFDGSAWHACKTPLGRQGVYKVQEKGIETEKKKYELICTPKELAEFQKEQPDQSWFDSDMALVQALRLVLLIDGEQNLLDQYREELKDANSGEAMAIRQKRALIKLKEDLDSFSLKLGHKEEGKLFDVKKDIFRLGDRVIDDLANYYNIIASKEKPGITIWEVIDRMKQEKILNPEGAQHLKEAISIATELRLATYDYHQGQSEYVSTYLPALGHLSEELQQPLQKIFHIQDTKFLHHYYQVMTTLQHIVRGYHCTSSSHQEWSQLTLQNDSLFDNSTFTKAMIHKRFMEYDEALDCMIEDKDEVYEKAMSIDTATEEAKGVIKEALSFLDHTLSLCSKTGDDELFDETAKQYEELLKGNKASLDKSTIAQHYFYLGDDYLQQQQYSAALKCLKEAFKKDDSPNLNTVYCHKALGRVYRDDKRSEIQSTTKAIEEFREAIRTLEKVIEKLNAYGDKHMKIADAYEELADTYNDLGCTYQDLGKFGEAIKIHKQAVDIATKIYKDVPGSSILANTLNNLGNAYNQQENYQEAIDSYKQAINEVSAPDTPIVTFQNLGFTYYKLGKHYKDKKEDNNAIQNFNYAIKYYEYAIEIAYANSYEHHNLARLSDELGDICYTAGKYQKAISHIIQAMVYYKDDDCKFQCLYHILTHAYENNGEPNKAQNLRDGKCPECGISFDEVAMISELNLVGDEAMISESI